MKFKTWNEISVETLAKKPHLFWKNWRQIP